MRIGYETIENFFPGAEAMRAGFEEHCSRPHTHTPGKHQIWNYWYVPDTYTYLRTAPEKVMPRQLVDSFFERLCAVSFERWGLSKAYWPYLSCYVAGCYQALHNDAVGGRLGYVYSLTRWDSRNFKGGETLIFREDGYFGTGAITRPGAATSFYDLIPPKFNQLLVFDDRLPHAVPRIEGGMDPVAGRLVMHGHLEEGGIAVEGELEDSAALPVLADAQGRIQALANGAYHGLLTMRLWVRPDGSVKDVVPLLERVLPVKADAQPFDTAHAVDSMRKADFPEAPGESRITVPIAFTC